MFVAAISMVNVATIVIALVVVVIAVVVVTAAAAAATTKIHSHYLCILANYSNNGRTSPHGILRIHQVRLANSISSRVSVGTRV